MIKSTIALRLDTGITRKFKQFCKVRGIKYGFFVQEAIREKLESEDDLFDFKTLRPQEQKGVSWKGYLKKRDV